jgi:hypothetical protein
MKSIPLSVVSNHAGGQFNDGNARAPVALKEETSYVIELDPDPRARPGERPERFVMVHSRGYWHSTNDGAYEEGPIPVALAGYKVIAEIDLWAF